MPNLTIKEHSPIAITEGLQDFGIETDLTAEELFDVATQAFSASLFTAVKSGVAFMAAQEALKISGSDASESHDGKLRQSESPTFKSWIKARKLTEQRVYEVIKLAKGYLAIPAAQRKSYLSIGKYKALKLASIEPEALADLAEKGPETLDEMALMSRDELAKKIANLKAQLDTAQSKNKRQEEANNSTRLTVFEPRTEEIRKECMALQLEAELPINSLQKLFEEVNAEDPALPEWRLQIEQVWIAAHVVAARAMDMLERMSGVATIAELPERIQGHHILTPAEAERWMLDFPMIENRHEGKKAFRKGQDEADANVPKKRGPKPGSKRKAAGE